MKTDSLLSTKLRFDADTDLPQRAKPLTLDEIQKVSAAYCEQLFCVEDADCYVSWLMCWGCLGNVCRAWAK